MAKIQLEYLGDLQVKAHHELSGVSITTDAPVDNMGQGRSFSPTDLVATALAACIATIMGIVAARHEIDLKGMTLDVQKLMTQDKPRRIAQLIVDVCVPTKLSPSDQTRLQNAALRCPVKQSLASEVLVDIRFHWQA